MIRFPPGEKGNTDEAMGNAGFGPGDVGGGAIGECPDSHTAAGLGRNATRRRDPAGERLDPYRLIRARLQHQHLPARAQYLFPERHQLRGHGEFDSGRSGGGWPSAIRGRQHARFAVHSAEQSLYRAQRFPIRALDVENGTSIGQFSEPRT